MIYLDKSNQDAIKYVTNFIDDNWLLQNDTRYKYQNIGYAQIKNPVSSFRFFFIEELSRPEIAIQKKTQLCLKRKIM